ncbi:50S ribosomal protein L25 [Thermodesulfobacteriota bacterium]
MAQHQLAAKVREIKGKEAAKKLRKENKIPAVFYGADSGPIMLIVEESELKRLLKTTASDNIIMGLKIESEKGAEDKMVILKELQTDPIKDKYLHADFHEIKMDEELTLNIPVVLVNIPAGVTNEGGILQHVRRELEISCLPGKVIESIEVDVSDLNIGDSIHIEDITFPEGIKSTQEEHLTIAVVNAPTVIEEPEEEEELEEGEGEETEETEGESSEETEAE